MTIFFLGLGLGIVVGVAATFGLAVVMHSSQISATERERDHPDAY